MAYFIIVALLVVVALLMAWRRERSQVRALTARLAVEARLEAATQRTLQAMRHAARDGLYEHRRPR
jgi:hypothetical protein